MARYSQAFGQRREGIGRKLRDRLGVGDAECNAQMSVASAQPPNCARRAARRCCSAASTARVIGTARETASMAALRNDTSVSSANRSAPPARPRCLPPMVRQTRPRSRESNSSTPLLVSITSGPETPMRPGSETTRTEQRGDQPAAAVAAGAAADQADDPGAVPSRLDHRTHDLGDGELAGIRLLQTHAAGIEQDQHRGALPQRARGAQAGRSAWRHAPRRSRRP